MVTQQTCQAKVKVDHYFAGVIELPCCLFDPHMGYKHENPRLLLTVGGDRIEKDIEGNDITGSWSPYVEAKGG